MANHTATLYIRRKAGYCRTPKKLTDLPEGENYQLFWYEGTKRKSKAVGRFADAARIAVINKEAELRKATITGALPEPVVPGTPSLKAANCRQPSRST
jgi:hypothetical protein